MDPLRLFLSYAREDLEFALRLRNELAQHPELDPWIDVIGLLPGCSDWESTILNRIDNSDFFIVLLSTRSVSKDGFLQAEMRESLDRARSKPPGQRFIIPCRLDDCTPAFRELSHIQRLDLFPDWSHGVQALCESFEIKHYSSRYVAVSGGGAKLLSLNEKLPDNVKSVRLVDASSLPKILPELVPTDRMKRESMQLAVFWKLWTVASACWPQDLYRKSEWRDLDELLFASFASSDQRTVEDKRRMIEIIIRQWALAKELRPYDEDDWRALRKLIQNPTFYEE
jgi:hypothetical protein